VGRERAGRGSSRGESPSIKTRDTRVAERSLLFPGFTTTRLKPASFERWSEIVQVVVQFVHIESRMATLHRVRHDGSPRADPPGHVNGTDITQ